jgi:hypothetical protein
MNIWILYYSSLFLHISILYNFIFLIILFFDYPIQFYINYSIQFYFKKYFLNITDGYSPSVFSKELEKIYCICHNHRWTNSVGDLLMVIRMNSIRLYFSESWKKLLHMLISLTKICRQNNSVDIFLLGIFFGVHFLSVKPSVVFFLPTN